MTLEADTAELIPADDGLHADDELMLSLLGGTTIAAAARRAGVSYATAKRRVADPEFRARLIDLRHDLVDRVAAQRISASLAAVAFLVGVMRDDDAPLWHRLQAARTLAANPLAIEAQLTELRGV